MNDYTDRILSIAPIIARKSLFLFGPRQTGKTSYIQNQLKKQIAFSWNLLDGRLRLQLEANPSLLREEIEANGITNSVVFIDEIQKCPQLLDEIHTLIEERSIRFLLIGSSIRKLRREGVDMLGGRALQRNFHPFVYQEVKNATNGIVFSLERLFERGMIPSLYYSQDIEEDLGAYVNIYLTEEIATEGLVRNLPGFARFLQVAAHTNTQLVNYANIASDAHIPAQTVKLWYQILIDTLIGYEVPPFTATKKRKAIGTSKFYLFDIGVVRALRNLSAPDEASTEFGEFFEHFICMELKAWIDYTTPGRQLTYWRATAGQEVDFLVDTELAIEVKAARTISDKHLKGLRALREENLVKRYIVVCREERPRIHDGIEILPWRYFLDQLWGNVE
ncbi:MAG: AAA family ATPase [Sphaerochaeta sp.]